MGLFINSDEWSESGVDRNGTIQAFSPDVLSNTTQPLVTKLGFPAYILRQDLLNSKLQSYPLFRNFP